MDNATPTRVEPPSKSINSRQALSITNWLVDCYHKGYVLGPFVSPDDIPYEQVYVSPIFTVLKPNFAYSVVCDLSYPKYDGISINDCIDPNAKRVQYISFVELCRFIYELGPDARLWVVDAQDAYYRVPIKEIFYKYMGLRWYGVLFLFTRLPMGLASACAIYQLFADAVLHIIVHNHTALFISDSGDIFVRHYLDDFFGGHTDIDVATQQVLRVEEMFKKLGIPTQRRKLRFPDWIQVLLGWLFNTRLRTVSVPAEKVVNYCARITKLIRERLSGTCKTTLEELKGVLQWAAPVVYPGKARLRNLDYAMHLELHNYDDKIILSDLVINDLKWWRLALQHSNGVPLEWIIQDPTVFDDEVWTDAATTQGAGGCSRSGFAYQYLNSDTIKSVVEVFRSDIDIKLLELLAVYVMAVLMKDKWMYKNVKFYCDNSTAVSSLVHQRGPLRRRDLQYLVVKFAELSAKYHFRFWIVHIDGDDNDLADDLSRFKSAYRNNNLAFTEYQFFSRATAIQVANDIFLDLLDITKVPLNARDPREPVLTHIM